MFASLSLDQERHASYRTDFLGCLLTKHQILHWQTGMLDETIMIIKIIKIMKISRVASDIFRMDDDYDENVGGEN